MAVEQRDCGSLHADGKEPARACAVVAAVNDRNVCRRNLMQSPDIIGGDVQVYWQEGYMSLISTGDARFADAPSGNYCPGNTSVLRNRVGVPLVPVDVQGRTWTDPDAIGALSQQSD